jgi:uncharacterized protein (TIGR03435 family)
MHRGLTKIFLMGVVVLVAGNSSSVFVRAQSSSDHDDTTQFEVASVHRVKQPGLTQLHPLGTPVFRATNVSLRVLIEMAFGIDDVQMINVPSWIDFEFYDVSARLSDDRPLTREGLKAPLQQLLEERFHLSAHRKDMLLPGYILVVAKGGSKLKPAAGEGQSYLFPNSLVAKNVTSQTFAEMLARPLGRPVEDRTGLLGSYDVELSYAALNDKDSDLPSIFVALKESLGLEVKKAKVSVSMLEIDHLDRDPTSN